MTAQELHDSILKAEENGIIVIEDRDLFENGDKTYTITIHEPKEGWRE